ncbi:SGNH/GDSL hydrolase family protein [Arthrobacter globiformis]|uniref:SGNH/GDSL hydrolase family protein n=1 Tax=Arthrobacter globiformis TaxID=1665 RepID=UPI0027882B4F|nr:SGNH/GDSL hydrolase family protein [Arthrobacter globiformis]MDQ0865720.1 lysophospholipase L1-like esterase [Arthrobacter globiformis]
MISRISTWQQAYETGTVDVDFGDGIRLKLGDISRNNLKLSQPGDTTDSRTALSVRVPFKAPSNISSFRVHFRNRHPVKGTTYTGGLSFTAVGIGQAQTTGDTIFVGITETISTTIEGAFTTPADGSEHVTPWMTWYPLTEGVWYHLSYGYNGPAQQNYAGTGTAWTNTSPTSCLNKTLGSPTKETTIPVDVWIEAVVASGGTTEFYAGQVPPAATVSAPTVSTSSRTSITTFGDSLTDGGSNGTLWPESDTWPYKLDTTLTTATVTNLGYSGATVDEMLMRVGAMPMRVTVPSGGIAGGGANAFVTPLQTYGMPAGTRPIDATLNGGAGVRLTKNTDGTWQLYNYGTDPIPAGTALITPASAWAGHNADTAIIWIGINDITGNVMGVDATVADHVVGGTQKLIEWLTPQVKQFLILGVTTRTNETTGSANHTTATEINSRLQALYPGKFKSIQKYLREQAMTDLGITPTQDDLDKIAAGTLPPSVLDVGDIGHISKATATVVANNLIAPWLKAKGYVDG